MNVQENVQKFLKHWDEHIQKNNVNFSDKKSSTRKRLKLWKPLFSSFHLRFLLSAFIAVFYYVGGFASPLVSYFSGEVFSKKKKKLISNYIFSFSENKIFIIQKVTFVGSETFN